MAFKDFGHVVGCIHIFLAARQAPLEARRGEVTDIVEQRVKRWLLSLHDRGVQIEN